MKIKLSFLLFLLACLLLVQCAKIVPPKGGPKDEEPPVLMESSPRNYSTQFSDKSISLNFNEFVEVNNISQKLIVSPPMEKNPEIISRGKEIEINFQEDLLENTTYTLNFNDAIVDFNEGNPLENFQFVFSTGDELDSMVVSGSITRAFNNKPAGNVYAMLYDTLCDSIPYTHVPYYLSKTNDKGYFEIHHVKYDTFKLFILQDQDMNYKYNGPGEGIAYTDSTITFELVEKVQTDSLSEDSVITDTTMAYSQPEFKLRLFNETVQNQYIKKKEWPAQEYLRVVFNRPPFDSVEFTPLYQEYSDNWKLIESYREFDSLHIWLKDTNLYSLDTLSMAVRYHKRKGLDSLRIAVDTVFFRYFGEKGAAPGKDTIQVSPAVQSGGSFNPGKKFFIRTQRPVQGFDTSRIQLYKLHDSTKTLISYTFDKDTNRMRHFIMNHSWQEDSSYQVMILPGAFTGMYGASNDTTESSFRVNSADKYGNIIFNISGVEDTVMIHLLNRQKEKIDQRFLHKDQTIRFEYLDPGKYYIKAIFDRNGNKEWDTGHYLKGKQPEYVSFYPKEIQLRANWDIEEDWELEKGTALPEKEKEEKPGDQQRR